MSSIKILQKSLPSKKKNLLFILNADNIDSTTRAAWDALENSTTTGSSTLSLERVDIYNALRAYMDEEGIPYTSHGELSKEYLIRLEDGNDIKRTSELLKTIAGYGQLESSTKTRSVVEDEGLTEFKQRMNEAAKRYQ